MTDAERTALSIGLYVAKSLRLIEEDIKRLLKTQASLSADLRYNKLEGERPGSLRPNGTP